LPSRNAICSWNWADWGRWCGAAPESELELLILLNRADPALENAVAAANFALFSTPAINLFPKRADRIHLSDQVAEHHGAGSDPTAGFRGLTRSPA
jgi:hypothetical protein